MLLAHFEERLPARDIIAAVTVNEDDAPKTVSDEIVRKPAYEVDVASRPRGQGARKIHVMIRVPEPHQRREEHFVFQRLGRASDNFAKQKTIGEYREVMSMLLQRCDGKNYGRILI